MVLWEILRGVEDFIKDVTTLANLLLGTKLFDMTGYQNFRGNHW